MNILRTVQKIEHPGHIELFFTSERPEKSPYGTRLPSFPLRFPFPFRFREHVKGGYLYLVYRNKIVGYGLIASVVEHHDAKTGSNPPIVGKPVRPGEAAVIDGTLIHMPLEIHCRGFVGVRYTKHNLHELDLASAQRVIYELGLNI
jgi:hypothetical protein